MEPKGSLACWQEPATHLYPEPDESIPYTSTLFPKIHSDIIFPSTLRSSEYLFPSVLPAEHLQLLN
jgi:hypothetical protein